MEILWVEEKRKRHHQNCRHGRVGDVPSAVVESQVMREGWPGGCLEIQFSLHELFSERPPVSIPALMHPVDPGCNVLVHYQCGEKNAHQEEQPVDEILVTAMSEAFADPGPGQKKGRQFQQWEF